MMLHHTPYYFFWIALAPICTACIEPYKTGEIKSNPDFLVVDGYVNSKEHSIVVSLSHATGLTSTATSAPEENAIVSVESSATGTYALNENTPGRYEVNDIATQPEEKFILKITTKDGKQYASDAIGIKESPPIGSVDWVGSKDGVKISVSSSDPTGNSRYYRWEFIETWEYHAAFPSVYKLVNRYPVARKENEFVHDCYQTNPSTKIFVASTVRLKEDVVLDFPLTFIPVRSQKTSVRYSILVKQYALTKEEYDFWDQLKKTTESLGGLFDPQPSQVLGNIHDVNDPAAPVLGLFRASAPTEKRIFIDYEDLPDNLQIPQLFEGCVIDTVCLVKTPQTTNCTIDLPNLSGTEIIVDAIIVEEVLTGFLKTSSECGDCRYYGGTLEKPDFW